MVCLTAKAGIHDTSTIRARTKDVINFALHFMVELLSPNIYVDIEITQSFHICLVLLTSLFCASYNINRS